jgi:hypothetical protein
MKLTDLAMAFQCAFRTAGSIPLRPAALCALSPRCPTDGWGSGTFTRGVGGPFTRRWGARWVRALEGDKRGNTPFGLLTKKLLHGDANCKAGCPMFARSLRKRGISRTYRSGIS